MSNIHYILKRKLEIMPSLWTRRANMGWRTVQLSEYKIGEWLDWKRSWSTEREVSGRQIQGTATDPVLSAFLSWQECRPTWPANELCRGHGANRNGNTQDPNRTQQARTAALTHLLCHGLFGSLGKTTGHPSLSDFFKALKIKYIGSKGNQL